MLAGGASLVALGSNVADAVAAPVTSPADKARWSAAIKKGLGWLVKQQSRSGGWANKAYPVAVSALSGTALILSLIHI